MAICMHFYNREDADRNNAANNEDHVEVVDIQAHSYAYLVLTCTRSPRVQYNIVRPAFLNFKFTPKKMLIFGAASVMCLMCVLVLMTLALLWVDNMTSDERSNAEAYATTFSQFMDQYEYRDGEPLRQAMEGAELLGSFQVASFVQELGDEARNLDHAATMMSGAASVVLRPDEDEADRIVAAVSSALRAGYAFLTGANDADRDLSSLDEGRPVMRTIRRGAIGSMPRDLYDSVILPMLRPIATATGSTPPKSPSEGNGWDFAVFNMSAGVSAAASPPFLTRPSVVCPTCTFARDMCGTLSNEDLLGLPAQAARTEALAAATARGAFVVNGEEVNDGYGNEGITESVLLTLVNATGVLSTPANTPGAPMPASRSVDVVSVSAHMPFLGITVCFFKPRARFIESVRSQLPAFFTDKYASVFSQMSFQMNKNLIRYIPSPSASTNPKAMGSMAHLTPLEIYGPLKVGCTDGNGCENGNMRNIVAASANRCNTTASSSARQQVGLGSHGPCEVVSSTQDAVDNSSTPVICASRSYGFPLVTDTTVVLCRSRAAVQQLSIDMLVRAADLSNAEHFITDAERSAGTASAIVVATRNATTGIIRPQANAYTLASDCRAGTGTQCFRTAPAARAANDAFTAGRAAAARHSGSLAMLTAYQPTNGRTANIAPDYRLHVPVFQGYVYLPLLDTVVGCERAVMMARAASYESILALATDINAGADAMAIVPVTRYITFEPTRHYDPREPCPAGVVCLDRAGYGVTYRSDCADCSETGLLGPIHSLISLPHCTSAADDYTCTREIVRSSIYHEPFSHLQGGAGAVGEAASYYGEPSLYAPIYVRNISLGIVLHFYTQERLRQANNQIYIAVGVSCGLIVVALTIFLVLSRNNLNQVEREWVQYKKSISTQNSDFAKVVGDVVPPVYAPLLFVPTSQIAERLNITTIFINFVGFQRHILDQDADFVHDYMSYTFYTMNAITRYYRMFKVKTFGDNFMIVGGVNKQMATRGAAIRKLINGDGSVIAATMTNEERDNVDDNEDGSIVRCVESAAVLMQLFSYLFQHNPQHIGFLRKRLKLKQLTEMAMMRIGIATGPTNLIMTRHDGFPFFLALSEHAAVSYKLQQAAKSNSINISAEVKKAIVRLGKDSSYEFGKDRTLLHKKLVVSSCLIQKADVPIPKAILNALRVSRAPCRLFFTEEGSLKAAVPGAFSGVGTGASTQQMMGSEKGSVHSGTNGGLSNAMANALRRMR